MALGVRMEFLGLQVLSLGLCLPVWAQDLDARADRLRALLRASPRLPLSMTDFRVKPPPGDWTTGFVSSLAIDAEGVIYIFHRGPDADPVIAVNRDGKVLRSWGRGLFQIPHSIRVDPAGNIWTVDAGNSMVHRFTRDGKQLLAIDAGGLPEKHASAFAGATDIAFAGERVFIADGYVNARIVEYRATGQRVREWGKPGTAPGEFRLPHGIAIDDDGSLCVADRENGRIQRFTLDGVYLGEWSHLGKTFSLTAGRTGDLWIGTQPHNVANGVEPWLVRVDRRTGRILGAIESGGHHSIDVNSAGEPMTGARPDKILWFRKPAP